MMKKKKTNFKKLKKYIPYFLTGVITLALVSIGSIDKGNTSTSLSIDAFAGNNYKVSIDQVSGLYAVANLSDALGLASAPDVANNYMVATALYDSGQSSITGRLEKPPITNIVTSRGVVEYVVADGENMDTIAAKFGVSTDQIRWSNGKKTKDVTVGEVLYIPSTSGIVYTVKSGDTIESIVSKYGSTAAEIIALNDLEVSGLSEGMRILVKGGSLPETERPEYVPPAPRVTYTYTYAGSSYSRQNIRIIATGFYVYSPDNPGVRGNCTWYAWYWRATDPRSLGKLGREGRNANTWHYNYAYRGVGKTPRVGAVFQSVYGGYGYGHVGVVTAINADGSIEIEEMNYAGYSVVNAATIPADQVGNFNYIY